MGGRNMSLEFKVEYENGNNMTLSQPVEETTLQKLNRLAAEAGYDNISPYAIEIIGWEEGSTSTTVVFNRHQDEAYSLTPIMAGRIRVYQRDGIYRVPEEYTGVVGIHRALVSYMFMSRINNLTDLKMALQPIINTGIMDLINQFGNIMHGYKISMQMPGYENLYIRENDSCAGYEIRLILTKE